MTDQPHAERLTAADGHEFECWIHPAEGEARGGIVILQEIFGVTDQLKGIARRYAALGYDIAIPALFDRRERDAVIPFDQGARGRELMLTLPADEAMRDAAAAVSRLSSAGKVGVIGFCWGGGLALRAAQTLDIGGAVAFYGTMLTQYLNDDLKAPVQFHFGEEDGHVPPEMRAAVKERFPQVEIFTYPTGHAFANDARPAMHDPEAAETAHERAAAFFARVLG